MYKRQFAKIAALGLALATTGLTLVAQAQTRETVKVGVLLSVSGPAAAFGIPERDTVQVLLIRHQ